MGTTITSLVCPECKKTVWVNMGDLEDVTVGDITSVSCFWCRHVWFLEYMDEYMGGDPKDYAEDSFGTPNEAAGL